MIIEDLFTMNSLKEYIRQINMSENDEKMIILCEKTIMIKNMET
jgi:hypothetical protein